MSGNVPSTGKKNENKLGAVPALKKLTVEIRTEIHVKYAARCSHRGRNKLVGRTKVGIDKYTGMEPRTIHRRGNIRGST